jgi:hypothetical protein
MIYIYIYIYIYYQTQEIPLYEKVAEDGSKGTDENGSVGNVCVCVCVCVCITKPKRFHSIKRWQKTVVKAQTRTEA